jgi:hypothetical protein
MYHFTTDKLADIIYQTYIPRRSTAQELADHINQEGRGIWYPVTVDDVTDALEALDALGRVERDLSGRWSGLYTLA